MVKVYSDADFLAIIKQRERVLAVIWGVSILYALTCISMIIYLTSLPYAHPQTEIPKIVIYVVTVLFLFFMFPFVGIKYSRIRHYYKLISDINTGLTTKNKNEFKGYGAPEAKYFVDSYVLVFKEYSKKTNDYLDRKIYFDCEKPLPEFEIGEVVSFVTQSNMLVKYTKNNISAQNGEKEKN